MQFLLTLLHFSRCVIKMESLLLFHIAQMPVAGAPDRNRCRLHQDNAKQEVPGKKEFRQNKCIRKVIGSNLVWCGLLVGTKWRKYCNKQALICNRLRTMSKIGGDTPSHKASVFVKLRRAKSAVQAQVLSEKFEQLSNFTRFLCGR